MRRALPLLAISLLLAAGLWMIRGTPAPETLPPEPSAVSYGATVAAAAATEGAASLAEAENGRRATVAGEGLPASWFVVRVVCEEDGRSVPGVSVRLLDWGDPANAALSVLRRDQLRDREADFARFGVVSVTDADGRAHFPQPRSGQVLVVARHDDLYGEAWGARVGTQQLELRLQREVRFRVLVVDDSGRPVHGAPVAWLTWFSDQARARIRTRSGADGIADLRHAQRWLPGEPGWRHTLALLLPGAVQSGIAFDPLAPPSEPPVLRLPACGSVEVEVLDADSRPFADGTQVFLQVAPDDAERSRFWDRYEPSLREEAGATPALTASGVARFDFVPIGVPLEAFAFHEDLRDYFGSSYAGLSAPGEHRRLLLRLDRAPTVLTGRLMRPDGSPIADARVTARLAREDGSHGWVVATSADGVFRQFLDESDHPPGPERCLWLAHTDGGPDAVLLARVALPEPFGPGDAELGEIVLGGGGIIASGHVVDADGAPLAGVEVGYDPRVDSGAETVDSPRGAGGGGHLTGADGAFAIAGAAHARAWRLSFARDGWRTRYLNVESGSTDLQVVLERQTTHAFGSLLLDKGVDPQLLEVRWKPDAPAGANEIRVRVGKDGNLLTEQAGEGLGTVRVVAKWRDEVLASLTDVPGPRPGAPDPRLAPLDLRGRVRAHEVHVVGPEVRVPGEVGIRFEGAQPQVHSGWPNPIRFVTAEPSTEVTLFAPSAAARRLVLPGGRAEIRVEKGRVVRWELLGEEWREGGARIRLGLALAGSHPFEFDVADFVSESTAMGFVPGPGEYRICVRYAFESGGMLRTHTGYEDVLTEEGATMLRIPEGDEPLVLRLRLKEGAMARALASVQEADW